MTRKIMSRMIELADHQFETWETIAIAVMDYISEEELAKIAIKEEFIDHDDEILTGIHINKDNNY